MNLQILSILLLFCFGLLQSNQFVLAENAVHQAIDNFCFALVQSLENEWTPDKNIFLSPLGLSTVLTMLMAGAGGKTYDELYHTLG